MRRFMCVFFIRPIHDMHLSVVAYQFGNAFLCWYFNGTHFGKHVTELHRCPFCGATPEEQCTDGTVCKCRK